MTDLTSTCARLPQTPKEVSASLEALASDPGAPTVMRVLLRMRNKAYPWTARSHLALHLLQSQDEDFIEKVITCSDKYWEHGLEFPGHIEPSYAFKEVVRRNPKTVWGSVTSYYSGWGAPKQVRPRIPNQLDLHEGPWEIIGTAEDDEQYVEDAAGVRLFNRPEDYDGDWTSLVEAVMRNCRRAPPEPVPEAPAEDLEPTPEELAAVEEKIAADPDFDDLPF